MGMELPQSGAEWFALFVPLASILIGLAYFLAPSIMLRRLGLAPSENNPDAVGEGRSSFAGFPIGIGLCALAFGQPILLSMLGVAFAVAACGKLIHLLVDDMRGPSAFVRLGAAILLAAIALWQAGLPQLAPAWPDSRGTWLVGAVAAITLAFGVVCMFAPRTALVILRLRPFDPQSGAAGELRGTLAGYYTATGLLALAGDALFAYLALGAAWLATAFGRIVSMLSDRANNLFNWLSLAMELVLAALPLALVFGLMG